MSSRLLFRLTAVAVLAAGLVMAVAGAWMSVWAWTTAEIHIAFRIFLPLATAWLAFTLVKLVRVLPEAWKGEPPLRARDPLTALKTGRQVALPREPERRRRRRIARRVDLPGGGTLYRVQPVPRPPVARRAVAAAAVVIAAIGLFFALGPIDLEDVRWIASLFRALEELPGLFQRVDAVGLLATLGFGARRHQQRL